MRLSFSTATGKFGGMMAEKNFADPVSSLRVFVLEKAIYTQRNRGKTQGSQSHLPFKK